MTSKTDKPSKPEGLLAGLSPEDRHEVLHSDVPEVSRTMPSEPGALDDRDMSDGYSCATCGRYLGDAVFCPVCKPSEPVSVSLYDKFVEGLELDAAKDYIHELEADLRLTCARISELGAALAGACQEQEETAVKLHEARARIAELERVNTTERAKRKEAEAEVARLRKRTCNALELLERREDTPGRPIGLAIAILRGEGEKK